MDDHIKCYFSKDEISFIGKIIESDDQTPAKIEHLFNETIDPLLSSKNVKDLLNLPESLSEVENILGELVASDTLECDDKTQRVLEKDQTTLYRIKGIKKENIDLFALEYASNSGIKKYLFSCDGKIVRNFSRIDRLDALSGTGQQRQEIKSHIERIAEGIKNGSEIPNSILLVMDKELVALDSSEEQPDFYVKVEGTSDEIEIEHPNIPNEFLQKVRPVKITIPYRKSAFDSEKRFMIVDGQQRTAGLTLTNQEDVPTHQVPVVAILADAENSREIFKIANQTQKITIDFSRALSGESSGFEEESINARILKTLIISDEKSPFYQKVKYPNLKVSPSPKIVYNSLYRIVKTIRDCVFLQDKSFTEEDICEFVTQCYSKIIETWPEAWDSTPKESKLVHGAGLLSFARFIVYVVGRSKFSKVGTFPTKNHDLMKEIFDGIDLLKPLLIWSEKEYSDADKVPRENFRKHIETVQNTPTDIDELSSFLQQQYILALVNVQRA